MKLTLTKARKLDKKIADKVKGFRVKSHTDVRIKDTTKELVAAQVESERVVQKQEIDVLLSLVSARYKLRSLVDQANEKSGVSAKLTQMAQLEATLAVYNSLDKLDVAKDDSLVVDQLGIEQSNQGKVSDYGGVKTTMQVAIMSQEDKEKLLDSKDVVKKELEDLKDNLHGLNFTTTVELDASMVSLLQKHKLL